jgi:integrase
MAYKRKYPSGKVVYYATWYAIPGDPSSRQTKPFTDEAAAVAYEQLIRSQRLDGKFAHRQVGRQTTVHQLVQKWWVGHVIANGLVAHTRRKYQESLERLVLNTWLAARTIDTVDRPDIVLWRNQLVAQGVGASSIKHAMAALSSAFTFARDHGWVETHPLYKLARPRNTNKRQTVALSPYEVELIRQDLLTYRYGRRDDLRALKLALIVSVAAYGGLRPGEVFGLKRSDVVPGGVVQNDVIGAGDERRDGDNKTHAPGRPVRLPHQVCADLKLYLQVTDGGPGDWLFPVDGEDPAPSESTQHNFRDHALTPARKRVVARYPELADSVGRVTPYDLRRTMISNELRAGRPIEEVARRAGNTPAVIMEHYWKVIELLEMAGEPPRPVEDQIIDARRRAGSDVAQEALAARLLRAQPERARLLDLQSARARRRAS